MTGNRELEKYRRRHKFPRSNFFLKKEVKREVNKLQENGLPPENATKKSNKETRRLNDIQPHHARTVRPYQSRGEL